MHHDGVAMISLEQVATVACVVCSGAALAVMLHVQRSFGAYTCRIERAHEGTRRSQELTRQSNERLAHRLDEARADNEYTREASRAALTALLDEYHRLRDELNQRSA
jgi:hypothetical protein